MRMRATKKMPAKTRALVRADSDGVFEVSEDRWYRIYKGTRWAVDAPLPPTKRDIQRMPKDDLRGLLEERGEPLTGTERRPDLIRRAMATPMSDVPDEQADDA